MLVVMVLVGTCSDGHGEQVGVLVEVVGQSQAVSGQLGVAGVGVVIVVLLVHCDGEGSVGEASRRAARMQI